MLIVFDWDGTIARKEVANEASMRRFNEIGGTVSSEWLTEAQKTHAHFDVIKGLIAKKYGIHGEKEKTAKMTELFKRHYLNVVAEWEEYAFYEGMSEALHELSAEHTLAILSTLRQDLIDEALKILGVTGMFAFVEANTPSLDYSKQELMQKIMRRGERPDMMIGDGAEDMLAGKEAGARTILVLWGNHSEDAKNLAMFSAATAEEMMETVKKMGHEQKT